MKMIWQGRPGHRDSSTGPDSFMNELPFFANQKRIVLGNCGCYDPESIEEYIARGGYRAYVKAIRHYTFEEVCDIVEKSGLRGRSGGGYPTGLKWKHALNTSLKCQVSDLQCQGERSRSIHRQDNS